VIVLSVFGAVRLVRGRRVPQPRARIEPEELEGLEPVEEVTER
jgi:hypothetical protein